MTLSSGFGQTFFISLFNPQFRQEFNLSHGDIGGLYFLGTLLSAVTVIWSGKLIDQLNLKLYTGIVTTGLTIACITVSIIQSATMLVLAFFLLRLFGQGLSGHTGITTVSRTDAKYRGRCVSLASLGFSAAEIILPFATIWLIASWGWRQTWSFFAVVELLVIAVAAQLLLRQIEIPAQSTRQINTDLSSWDRAQVIRDKRFLAIAPALFSPSIISTALFFHQQSLAESKGFSLSFWAAGIAAYSVSAVLTSLGTGVLVDRFSGATMVRFFLVPVILAVLIAAFLQITWLPFIYYALIGATVGIGTPSVSALWLELYGAQHIGAIRAMTHAFMVFGTALGPFIFGYLLDAGVRWNSLLIASAIWLMAVSLPLITTKLSWQDPNI